MANMRITPDQSDSMLAWANSLAVGSMLPPSGIEAATAELKALGWKSKQIGKSQSGKPIVALHRPGIGPTVLAYGYPHPDEPAGATSLLVLGRAMASGDTPPLIEQANWWIVLCADPDQAELNNSWIESPGLDSYLRSHWRPIYQHLEVDYQFPIDHPPFWQPRHISIRGLPQPLPESLALAGLIEKIKPDLLALMHGNHASGVYTYLSHRPDSSLVEAWDQGTSCFGLQPHLGERPDPGKRWQTKRPDLLKERRLHDRLRRAETRFGDLDGRRLVGCVSVAQFLESLNPDAVVITPEVGLWQPTGIGDLSLSGQTRRVRIEHRQTSKGWRQFWYGTMKMPDGKSQDVCYHVLAADGPSRSRNKTVPLTAGMAGVEAVEMRRWFMIRTDQVYSKASFPHETVRLFERSKISVPGPRVNDQSMLIFRTAETYQRPATKAQCADLQYRWGMQTCIWIGHGLQLYLEQGDKNAAREQDKLLQQATHSLLGGLPELTPANLQVRSQLHRLATTLAAVS